VQKEASTTNGNRKGKHSMEEHCSHHKILNISELVSQVKVSSLPNFISFSLGQHTAITLPSVVPLL